MGMISKSKDAIYYLLGHVRKILTFIGLYFVKPSYGSKVFCVGYNKTGTTSIGKSLEMLGYRHSSFNKKVWRNYYANNRIEKILKYTAKFDSFDDLPWLKEDMIPILDEAFPESKFIYLTREEESWKKSLSNWRQKRFGDSPDLDEAWNAYKRHEKFVIDYFHSRPSDEFMILNIKDEQGFKKLADFLGKTTSTKRFPVFNKG